MKLDNRNILNKSIIVMFLFIAVVSINFFNVGTVSAATINIQPSSYYNTTHISLNDQIQNLANSAKDGDNLLFLGKYYENLSLIINKSLNLISNVNTAVSGDSTGQPVFLVTGSGSKWSNITGFNIKSINDAISIQNTNNITVSKNNIATTKGTGIKVSGSSGVTVKKNSVTSSNTGISVTNTKHSNITSNNVKKSAKNGVEIQKSNSVEVSNNNISSNGKHGVSIATSSNIAVNGNDIEHNNNNGVNLVDTNQVGINNNTISYNNFNGIYFDTNVNNTQIISNGINQNVQSGIELWGSGSYTKINSNIIDWNPIGIDINSETDYLDIGQNIITNSKFPKDYSNGVGINIGTGFEKSSTFTVNNNAIFNSGKWEIYAGDSVAKDVNIGYNWYGSSDGRQVRICPKIAAKLDSWAGFGQNGIYSAVFFEGTQFANMLSGFDVTFLLNNKTKITSTVINGTATAKFSSDDYLAKGNYLTIFVGYQQIGILISDDDLPAILEQLRDDESNGSNGGNSNGNGGSGGNGNGGNDSGGNGDGGNNGNGNSNNPGSTGQVNNGNSGGSTGQSQSTSSSTGSPKLERNSAQLNGAGEEAQSTSSQNQANDQQSKTAQEILLDNVNNPNLWSILVFVLLIATIVVVYYRHDIMSIYRK